MKNSAAKVYRVEILEPRAKKLLDELAHLKLIKVESVGDPRKEFKDLLVKLRRTRKDKPSLKEITSEVEQVRKKRYES